MAGHQQIMERIRRALGRGRAGGPIRDAKGLQLPELGPVMPLIPPEELVPKFESELVKASGSAYRAENVQKLETYLQSILEASGAVGVVLSRNPLLVRLGLGEKLAARGISLSVWPQNREAPVENQTYRERAFAAQVGITGVDFVLAESGTFVLSSITEGAQLASLAPAVHVVLYRRDQVVGSLEEVLEQLPIPRDPDVPAPGRAVVFITGPSRTADIEQILIRGVHGPREVHAILVEDSCLA